MMNITELTPTTATFLQALVTTMMMHHVHNHTSSRTSATLPSTSKYNDSLHDYSHSQLKVPPALTNVSDHNNEYGHHYRSTINLSSPQSPELEDSTQIFHSDFQSHESASLLDLNNHKKGYDHHYDPITTSTSEPQFSEHGESLPNQGDHSQSQASANLTHLNYYNQDHDHHYNFPTTSTRSGDIPQHDHHDHSQPQAVVSTALPNVNHHNKEHEDHYNLRTISPIPAQFPENGDSLLIHNGQAQSETFNTVTEINVHNQKHGNHREFPVASTKLTQFLDHTDSTNDHQHGYHQSQEVVSSTLMHINDHHKKYNHHNEFEAVSSTQENLSEHDGSGHSHHVKSQQQMDMSPAIPNINDHSLHGHHGTSVHAPADHESGNHVGHSMQMYFTNNVEVTILFKQWHVTTAAGLIGSAIGIFILAMVYEGLKFLREYLYKKNASSIQYATVAVTSQSGSPVTEFQKVTRNRMLSVPHLIQTLLHIVQFVISYFLMLIFMTYNVWICIAVVLGAGAGFFLFGWKKATVVDVTEHCH